MTNNSKRYKAIREKVVPGKAYHWLMQSSSSRKAQRPSVESAI